MKSSYHPNRKVEDDDLLRLNSVGLSLRSIGRELGCHPTTVTIRLSALGVSPADTRRSFMEEIYFSLNKDQKDWLENQVGPHLSIQDFVSNLLIKEYFYRKNEGTSDQPTHH